MYYVYKTINTVNDKYYIGVHKSDNIENDPYLGSGTAIKAAIAKYGKENFVRSILFITDNEEEAYQKESELVIISESSYNLTDGGKGSWSYVNSLNLPNPMHNDEIKNRVIASGKVTRNKNLDFYNEISMKNLKKAVESNTGKKHSEETVKKRSDSLKAHYKENTSKLLGTELAEEHKNKIKDSWSHDRKALKSEWMKLRVAENPDLVKGNSGKKFSAETKTKMSESMSAAWDNRGLTICPHCDKVSRNASNMYRWHFDNCKERKKTLEF